MPKSTIEHSDPRFESIRIDSVTPKNRNVRFDCTGCWRLSAKPPIYGLPQLRRQSRSRHTSARHHSSVSSFTAQSRSGILTSLFLAYLLGVPIFCEGARRTRSPDPSHCSQAALPPTSWVTAMCIGQ